MIKTALPLLLLLIPGTTLADIPKEWDEDVVTSINFFPGSYAHGDAEYYSLSCTPGKSVLDVDIPQGAENLRYFASDVDGEMHQLEHGEYLAPRYYGPPDYGSYDVVESQVWCPQFEKKSFVMRLARTYLLDGEEVVDFKNINFSYEERYLPRIFAAEPNFSLWGTDPSLVRSGYDFIVLKKLSSSPYPEDQEDFDSLAMFDVYVDGQASPYDIEDGELGGDKHRGFFYPKSENWPKAITLVHKSDSERTVSVAVRERYIDPDTTYQYGSEVVIPFEPTFSVQYDMIEGAYCYPGGKWYDFGNVLPGATARYNAVMASGERQTLTVIDVGDANELQPAVISCPDWNSEGRMKIEKSLVGQQAKPVTYSNVKYRLEKDFPYLMRAVVLADDYTGQSQVWIETAEDQNEPTPLKGYTITFGQDEYVIQDDWLPMMQITNPDLTMFSIVKGDKQITYQLPFEPSTSMGYFIGGKFRETHDFGDEGMCDDPWMQDQPSCKDGNLFTIEFDDDGAMYTIDGKLVSPGDSITVDGDCVTLSRNGEVYQYACAEFYGPDPDKIKVDTSFRKQAINLCEVTFDQVCEHDDMYGMPSMPEEELPLPAHRIDEIINAAEMEGESREESLIRAHLAFIQERVKIHEALIAERLAAHNEEALSAMARLRDRYANNNPVLGQQDEGVNQSGLTFDYEVNSDGHFVTVTNLFAYPVSVAVLKEGRESCGEYLVEHSSMSVVTGKASILAHGSAALSSSLLGLSANSSQTLKLEDPERNAIQIITPGFAVNYDPKKKISEMVAENPDCENLYHTQLKLTSIYLVDQASVILSELSNLDLNAVLKTIDLGELINAGDIYGIEQSLYSVREALKDGDYTAAANKLIEFTSRVLKKSINTKLCFGPKTKKLAAACEYQNIVFSDEGSEGGEFIVATIDGIREIIDMVDADTASSNINFSYLASKISSVKKYASITAETVGLVRNMAYLAESDEIIEKFAPEYRNPSVAIEAITNPTFIAYPQGKTVFDVVGDDLDLAVIWLLVDGEPVELLGGPFLPDERWSETSDTRQRYLVEVDNATIYEYVHELHALAIAAIGVTDDKEKVGLVSHSIFPVSDLAGSVSIGPDRILIRPQATTNFMDGNSYLFELYDSNSQTRVATFTKEVSMQDLELDVRKERHNSAPGYFTPSLIPGQYTMTAKQLGVPDAPVMTLQGDTLVDGTYATLSVCADQPEAAVPATSGSPFEFRMTLRGGGGGMINKTLFGASTSTIPGLYIKIPPEELSACKYYDNIPIWVDEDMDFEIWSDYKYSWQWFATESNGGIPLGITLGLTMPYGEEASLTHYNERNCWYYLNSRCAKTVEGTTITPVVVPQPHDGRFER